MRQLSVNITASSEEAALKAAASQLKTEADNIKLESLDNGQYQAELLNCDAEVEVVISDDKMTATIPDSVPVRGTGRPLSFDLLGRVLREAGVNVPPDPEATKSVVQLLAAGRRVHDVVIARGSKPLPARDAYIEPQGDWSFPVFPGDPLGKYVPAQAGKDGIRVDGTKIPLDGKKKGEDLKIPNDAGCHIDKVSYLLRSEHLGLVTVENREVRVHPLVHVVMDNMKVAATLHHKDFRGNRITPARLQVVVEAMEVVETVNEEAVLQAVGQAERSGQPVEHVVLCSGTPPKDGKDGWFEMVFQDDRSDVGLETDDGRVDFRARGMVRSVQPDELLGRLHEPEPGAPGRDVFGRVIPARDGLPFKLVLGENIKTSADGTQFYAAESGMVFFLKNVLDVTEVFQTSGDLDYSVGNLSLEKGSVHVRGSIMSGFSVESPRNVLVDDVIESALIKAGGDVEVKGGILMDKGGRVTAQGGISAMFAQNATLVAAGDVNIAHEVNNCVISAGRKIIATRGRGKIIGGVIRSGEGVVAKEIGSQLGVETTIYLGVDRKSDVDVSKKKELEETLQKIYAALGTGNIKVILEKTPPEKRQAVAELLKTRLRCEQELRDLENKINQEREELKSSVNARVKAQSVIYPGVIINCFGTVMKVDKPLSAGVVYYDVMKGKLVVG